MLDIFRSDIDGKYRINGQYELEHCFFCNTPLIPEEIGKLEGNDISQWIDTFNSYHYVEGLIGHRPLCRNCINDIKDIL